MPFVALDLYDKNLKRLVPIMCLTVVCTRIIRFSVQNEILHVEKRNTVPQDRHLAQYENLLYLASDK
jgi:hypothetical protein